MTASVLLQAGVVGMALVSLNPYLLWGYQKPAYAVATALVVLAAALDFRSLVFSRRRVILSVAFSLFLIYLSLLPKTDGGFTRWFFLIPFVVVLLHMRTEARFAVFEKFYWAFALSLLPGMVLWVAAVAGVSLEMRYTDVPLEIRQRGDTGYLELPGALFLLTNSLVLPHGGVLFRLCGIYDEPGTVGTIAALCLAASGFRFDRKGVLTFAAGLMSFSVAFAILVAIGLLATATSRKRPILVGAALLAAAVGVVPLLGLKSAPTTSSITVRMTGEYAPPAASAGGVQQSFAPDPAWSLRNAPAVDSRTQPWMRKLLDTYGASSVSTLLFGIASDASVVQGWGSSVWYRILTDFGAVGFVWLLGLFAWPVWRLWREGRLEVSAMIFCTLFLMSFYQRPIIWLPAQLLLYVAGLYARKKS